MTDRSHWICATAVLAVGVVQGCDDPDAFGGFGGWAYRPDFVEMRSILDETAAPADLKFQSEHTVGGAYGSFETTFPNVTRSYFCPSPESVCQELAALWGEHSRRDHSGAQSAVCRFEMWVPRARSRRGEDYRLFASVSTPPKSVCLVRLGIVRRPDRYDPSD